MGQFVFSESLITSGFSEVGKPELEQELVRVAQARGIRVLGPNCMGVYYYIYIGGADHGS